MKRAILVTGHYRLSKRRAGFHWLADALERAGWEVLFFTAAISWLSVLRRDRRLRYGLRRQGGKLLRVTENGLSFVWFTPWHPANLRLRVLNRLSRVLFRRYGDLRLGAAEELVRNAELIIFESTPGLLLFDRFKTINPTARLVYRASDDLRLLRNHPVVLEAERRAVPRFDLVSVPSRGIAKLFTGSSNVRLQPHGIRKELFDRDCPSPYVDAGGPNLIFVGSAHFDHDFLIRACRLHPDFRFHVIGAVSGLPRLNNVTAYGELPFEETVPYIKHADVGLQNIGYRPGAEAFTDSLKVIQYTYCRLPIVSPVFLKDARPNRLCYVPGDDVSVREALSQAIRFDRTQISTAGIHSWDELAGQLAGETALAGG